MRVSVLEELASFLVLLSPRTPVFGQTFVIVVFDPVRPSL